jgi:hypothetical protein
MSPERDKSKLLGPCLTLVAGLCWLFVAFLRFDSGHGGLLSHNGGVLLPSVTGLLFLASAILRFRDWLPRQGGEAQSAVTTLFGSKRL